eukprot:2140028-Amphidinium_carterae.1
MSSAPGKFPIIFRLAITLVRLVPSNQALPTALEFYWTHIVNKFPSDTDHTLTHPCPKTQNHLKC